jgi:hypothetical protein
MRAFAVFACIKTIGSLTAAMDFHEVFQERMYSGFLQGQLVDTEVWQASSAMLADLEYILKRQGETGHPICFEFVEKVLSEEGAPKTAYAV